MKWNRLVVEKIYSLYFRTCGFWVVPQRLKRSPYLDYIFEVLQRCVEPDCMVFLSLSLAYQRILRKFTIIQLTKIISYLNYKIRAHRHHILNEVQRISIKHICWTILLYNDDCCNKNSLLLTFRLEKLPVQQSHHIIDISEPLDLLGMVHILNFFKEKFPKNFEFSKVDCLPLNLTLEWEILKMHGRRKTRFHW